MKMYVVLIALCAAACHKGASANVSSHTKTVEIMDDAIGIVAYRMQIPDDWKFEGVLLHDAGCGLLPTVAFRATSPDGLTGYQQLPQFGWHATDNPFQLKAFRDHHCKIMQAMTPSEFLQYVVPAIRPQASVGPIEPTVDAKLFEESIAKFNARNAQMHLPGKESGGSVHARIQYTLHGQAIEENLRVVVNQFDTPLGPGQKTMSATADVIGLRAPKGQFDAVAAAIYPIVGKSAYTEEWTKRRLAQMANDSARTMAMIRRQGDATMAMMKRNHEAYMAESQRSFAKHNALEKDRQDAVHRSAVAWTLYAGDEQLVRNPNSGAVSRVTNQYGTNAHQDSVSGDIILSKDPNFDPSAYLRGNWTQLENVNPLAP